MKRYEAPQCPCCQKSMQISELFCETCDVSVRGSFSLPLFGQLSDEDLQFLLLFVHCEGRIRDMEKALGVSYPTVKSKLAKLKTQLGTEGVSRPPAPLKKTTMTNQKALESLANDDLSFEEALKIIKENKKNARRNSEDH